LLYSALTAFFLVVLAGALAGAGAFAGAFFAGALAGAAAALFLKILLGLDIYDLL
jgi:hypothetical protein